MALNLAKNIFFTFSQVCSIPFGVLSLFAMNHSKVVLFNKVNNVLILLAPLIFVALSYL